MGCGGSIQKVPSSETLDSNPTSPENIQGNKNNNAGGENEQKMKKPGPVSPNEKDSNIPVNQQSPPISTEKPNNSAVMTTQAPPSVSSPQKTVAKDDDKNISTSVKTNQKTEESNNFEKKSVKNNNGNQPIKSVKSIEVNVKADSTQKSTETKNDDKCTLVDGEGSRVVKCETRKDTMKSDDCQLKFSNQLNKLNLSVNGDGFIDAANGSVTRLSLNRAPPHTVNLYRLLNKLTNLQFLDVSNNQMGPQAFRLLMLAVSTNTSLVSLKAANNNADTDSSTCIGRLLTSNRTLSHLDVSGNHLGKDYLSRCVGPALKTNTSLLTFSLESTGATDVCELLNGLAENGSLSELDISNNDISNREFVGTALSKCLQKPDCVLDGINIKNCNMSPVGLEYLRQGLETNTSLLELNVSGNEFQSLENLMKFLQTTISHTRLHQLSADNIKIKDVQIKTDSMELGTKESQLKFLSLSNAGLTNEFISKLESFVKGKLLCLTDVNLSDNPLLDPSCIKSLSTMTTSISESGQSSIRRLTFGLNNSENIHEFCDRNNLPFLEYLNLRKAKISSRSVGKLQSVSVPPSGNLSTLVLDGLKLAGTEALKVLLACPTKECTLSALSLSGCLLSDSDLLPLTSALKSGLQLHMLKLSANRITDNGVTDLVSSLLCQKSHPLAVLDLSNNQVGGEGAKQLKSLFVNSNHECQLHSLNMSHNNIDKEGLIQLVHHAGSQLKSLHLNNQRNALEEGPVSEILTSLASSLGYILDEDDGGNLKPGCSPLPNSDQVYVNVSGLGGHAGDVGRLLDCSSIVTDYKLRQLPYLTLEDICRLSAYLRKSGTEGVVLSSEEWDIITGCKKDREIPSWLQVSECRDRAVYLTNLSATTTARRLEGLFETEADCNIDEICLLKDPVSRKMNGLAWALLSDKESVQRLKEFMQRGDAQVFGQPFLISRLHITVDDVASAEVAEQVRRDVERRAKDRQSEDATHRHLIRESADESWKRHAYRLAHPAYADGRVW